jgi:hypothetical protein
MWDDKPFAYRASSRARIAKPGGEYRIATHGKYAA